MREITVVLLSISTILRITTINCPLTELESFHLKEYGLNLIKDIEPIRVLKLS